MSLLDNLNMEDGTARMISECILQAQKHERIVAFGAGVGGKTLYNLLKKNGLDDRLIAWSDNNELKFGKTYMSDRLEVIRPFELVDRFGKNICVFVSSSAYDLIKAQLLGYGINGDNIYLFNFAFMDLEYTDCEFISDHMIDFERAYQKMADDKSKRIFEFILNYKITKNIEWLERMQPLVDDEYYQYFDEGLFNFIKEESILDVGAYTGDTFEKFNNIYQENWNGYYGFEADKIIYEELKKIIKHQGKESNVHTYNVAAWDKKTTLYFESNAGSSKMEKEITSLKMAVEGDRIDDILQNAPISLVKMDIEGAELNALRGMEKLIKINKPILAICVYHLRDDYYRITDFIEQTLPGEYTFYFRQYRYTPTETVCYAIPKNRKI